MLGSYGQLDEQRHMCWGCIVLKKNWKGFIQFPSYAGIFTRKAVPMTGTKFPLRDRRYKEKRIKLLNSAGFCIEIQ